MIRQAIDKDWESSFCCPNSDWGNNIYLGGWFPSQPVDKTQLPSSVTSTTFIHNLPRSRSSITFARNPHQANIVLSILGIPNVSTMCHIFLAITSLVLLFAPSSSAINLRSLTSLDAGSGPGFIHVPVQQTAQQTIVAPMIRRRDSGHYSAVALGHLSSALTTYTINISISGQDTTVVLDTGSSELWVDPTCSMAAGDNVKDSAGVSVNDQRHSSDYCESIGRYDPALSPTAMDLKSRDFIVYADTSTAKVNYYTDNISIGGLQISGQQFGVANGTSGIALGVMGMGPNVVYGYNSSSQPHSLVLDSMASQGLIASRAFSLNLREHDDATGSIVFGGVDQKKFLGSLQTLPLESLQVAAGASGDGSSRETITVHG